MCIHLSQIRVDLPGRQATRGQRGQHIIHTGQTPLPFGYDLRSKRWVTVTPDLHFDGADVGDHGLGTYSISQVTDALNATSDTYIKDGQNDRNEGGDVFMRVRDNGNNRALVRFDQAALQSAIGNRTVLSAKLRLTIVDNSNNWGPSGRTVDVHRLLSNWAEGNGTATSRGIGLGATWNCAIDSNIANQAKDCSGTTEWTMGQPNNLPAHPWVQTPTDTQIIVNGQSGIDESDVTVDVSAFITGSTTNHGWIVRKIT